MFLHDVRGLEGRSLRRLLAIAGYFTVLFAAKLGIAYRVIPRSVPVMTGNAAFLGLTVLLTVFMSLRRRYPRHAVFLLLLLFAGFLYLEGIMSLPAVRSERALLTLFYFVCILQSLSIIAFYISWFSYPAAGLMLAAIIGYDIIVTGKVRAAPFMSMLLAVVTSVFVFSLFLLVRLLKDQYEEEKRLLVYQKEILEKLAAAQDRLMDQQKYATLASLSAGIAHELKNPVNYLLGNLYFIREYFKFLVTHVFIPSGKTAESRYLERVRGDWEKIVESQEQGFRQISSITDNLGRLIRKEKENTSTEDLAGILNSVLDLFAASRDRKIEIKRNIRHSIPFTCYAGDFYSLFQNLLSNAADALPPAGGIISVAADFSGNDIRISFEDNGKGIPIDLQEKIFEPFFTTKEKGAGLGIGLSLCRSLIQRYKGNLRVDSAAGRGTKMMITIPGGYDAKNS